MDNSPIKHIYSISETAKTTGTCRTTVYDEIKKGNLKAKKFGKRTLIEVSEIERWIANLPEHTEKGGE